MGYPDIERVRDAEAVLRRIVDAHAGPGPDLRALRRVVDLCRGMAEATDDLYCQEKSRLLAEYCAELLSQGQHRPRGALSGIDFLRQQIRSTLELLQSRLYSLERARRVGAPGFVRPAFGTLHPR
jgi:hypothetical protein